MTKTKGVPYIETYKLLGTTYGIEDYQDGAPSEDHFMPQSSHKRFKCWSGGCCIGEADLLVDAHRLLADHMTREVRRKHLQITNLQNEITEAEEFISVLYSRAEVQS